MNQKISLFNLMIMTPNEIKNTVKKMDFKQINDLVSDIDNESNKMIKQNGKTSKQLLEMGILPPDFKKSQFYRADYVYNWKSTINQLLEIRKIFANSINKKGPGVRD